MGANTSSTSSNGNSQLADKVIRRRRFFKSFEAKALAQRGFAEKVADSITNFSGSIPFLILNVYWFVVWIVLNTNVIPGVVPFDPFPFGLLTMIVSLEAILLSVFVLLSQNRSAHIDSLRNELQLQVLFVAEEEITKSLQILAELRAKAGIKEEDPQLQKMLEQLDRSYIERALQKQMDNGGFGFMSIINNISGNGNSTNGNNQSAKQQEKTTK